MRVILMVGPSGSGKSTYVREHFRGGQRVLCADAIRGEITGNQADQSRNAEVFKILRKRMVHALRRKQTVVVDNTNLHAFARQEILGIAARFDAPVELRVMQATLEECLHNNAARPGRTVPEDVIRKQYQDFLECLGELHLEPPISSIILV